MKIKYPSHIKWSIDLKNRKIQDIILSKSFKSDIQNTIIQLENNGYKISIETVDNNFFDEFEPVYNNLILTKNNPQIFNTRKKILKSKLLGEYKAFVLRKNNSFIGALVLRRNQGLISCAYKVFPHKLDFYYRSNLASVIDYFGLQYALENDIITYTLGKDRNEYGVHTEIGLARYKISIGALPYISKSTIMVELNTQNYTPELDTVIFYTENAEQLFLDKALLYSNLSEQEIKNKYGALFKQTKIDYQIIKY